MVHIPDSFEKILMYGGGYSWSYFYYCRDSKKFFKDSYHTGSVDCCEDFYDGRKEVNESDVLRALLLEGYLSTILKYRDILKPEMNIDKALSTLNGGATLPDKTGFCELESVTYYKFEDGSFIANYYGTYFRVQNGRFVQDMAAVKDILFSKQPVYVYWKRYAPQWNSEQLI